MNRYPPGLIGVPCGDQARYSDFLPSVIAMYKPNGTGFMKANGLGPANPLNTIGRAFMDNPEYQWLFLTNDDNLCPVDTIPRLLDRNVDVVSGLYFGRLMPFEPIMFDTVEVVDRPGLLSNRWYHRHFMQTGEGGLQPAVAVGDGCLLIRRNVMEAIYKRDGLWWEYGETVPDACDHDVVFSRKVRELGFKVWVDFEVRVDHIANFVVRPSRKPNGEWAVQLVQGDGRMIELEVAHRDMKLKV